MALTDMVTHVIRYDILDSNETQCSNTNTIDASSEVTAESLQYRNALVIYTIIILPLLLIIGFLDNALFIIVVQKVENMKNVTNAYLASLAVADIAFLVFVIGHKLWKIIGSSEVVIDDSCLGFIGCAILFVGSSTSYFASLCFITLVAWERWQAVKYPHLVGKNRFHHRTKAIKMIILSWAISFILAASFVPSFIAFKELCIIWPEDNEYRLYPRRIHVCDAISVAYENYTHITQALPFFVAMALNLYFYFDIMRCVKKSADRVHSFDSLANATPRKREKNRVLNQTVRMLIINGLTFFAFLAPFEILSICLLFNGWTQGGLISTNSIEYRTVAWVARTLSYLNSLVNPVIFAIFSSRYRKAFKETLDRMYSSILPSAGDGNARKRGRPVSATPIVDNATTANDWNDNSKTYDDQIDVNDTRL